MIGGAGVAAGGLRPEHSEWLLRRKSAEWIVDVPGVLCELLALPAVYRNMASRLLAVWADVAAGVVSLPGGVAAGIAER